MGSSLGLLLILQPLVADETDAAATPDEPAGLSTGVPEFRTYGEAASAEDAEAISSLLHRFGEAWGSADVEGAVAAYAEDAEWVNAFGDVRRGHDELRDQFAYLFERFESGPEEPDKVEESAAGEPEADKVGSGPAMKRGRISTRYIGDNAVVLHSYTESDWGENRDDDSGVRHVRVTSVLEKREGKWSIVHTMIMDARQ